jgi:hypothetical protein
MFSIRPRPYHPHRTFSPRRARRPPRCNRSYAWPVGIERLERRALLADAGADYQLSGLAWPDPAHISYSIAPDGVYWDHGLNNLNSKLDQSLGAGNWERAIARALATWESVANIEISQVADSPNDLNTLGKAQGDPRFGDIRFGGYAFISNQILAETYFPPPEGSTEAGDVEVNTAMNFGTGDGSGYDFFSVMLHETGHALGLDEASAPADVMFRDYQGVRTGLGLGPGDIAGIQAIYGPRVLDAYQQQGFGLGLSTAIDATRFLDSTGKGVISSVALGTIGDTEFFSVVAPSGATGLQVTAAAQGVSMLSPAISLYDAGGNLIDAAANSIAWGDDVSVRATTVTPGERYFVAVTGATADAFAVGAYQLHVAFATTARKPVDPTVPTFLPPNAPATPISLPNPARPAGDGVQVTDLGPIVRMTATGLALDNPGDIDVFVFQKATPGSFNIVARGTYVRVVDSKASLVASGRGLVGIRAAQAGSTYWVVLTSLGGAPVSHYSLSITPSGASPRLRPLREKDFSALSLPAADRSSAISARLFHRTLSWWKARLGPVGVKPV